MNIAATRLHTQNGRDIKDLEEVYNWCIKNLKYFDKVLLVVDSDYFEVLNNSKYDFYGEIDLIHVPNWTGYTQALNMTIERALSLCGKNILFQSIEVDVDIDDLEMLETFLDINTLVVGAKLNEKHGSTSGEYEMHGWNCPWNTLAYWNLEKLALTGFLSVSSGNISDIEGGIEEMIVISLLQKLKPETMDAKLVSLPSLFWETNWTTKERELYHEKKMNSKDERAQEQLKELNIEAGKVIVLE